MRHEEDKTDTKKHKGKAKHRDDAIQKDKTEEGKMKQEEDKEEVHERNEED